MRHPKLTFVGLLALTVRFLHWSSGGTGEDFRGRLQELNYGIDR